MKTIMETEVVARHKPFSERQQQHLSPPSPDGGALRGWLAGLVENGTPNTTTWPSPFSLMSFKERNEKWLPYFSCITSSPFPGFAVHNDLKQTASIMQKDTANTLTWKAR